MTIIIEKFKTDRKWRFLWLQYINGVNLKHHCQRCLLGKTSKKIDNKTKELENIELDELDSRYYYLCGVAPSMKLEENFHLAFEERDGETIEYSFNGITVTIKNAKRVEFSADDINWDVEHSDEELYNRCRNWQFAHKVSNGGEITRFKSAENRVFESELILQRNTQDNLDLFDLEYVASEFQHSRLRFDTLAFESNTNSLVIIEYKNKADPNVINQVKSYKNLLLENKKEYIDKYNEVIKCEPKKEDFDEVKVIIIGPEFSDEQIEEAELYNFEIWKVELDKNCIIYENAMTNEEIERIPVTEEDLKLTEEELKSDRNEKILKLYDALKNRVLNDFSDVHQKILINAFSFRVNNNLICVVEFLKESFNVYFFTDCLNDPEEKTEDISNKTTAGNAHYKYKVMSSQDIDYFIELFKQVYEKNRR